MGNIITEYNPFTVYGNYNLKKSLYENKTKIITFLTLILLIVISLIVMYYGNNGNNNVIDKDIIGNVPPPLYGNGPYGKGFYLPPTEIIVSSVL